MAKRAEAERLGGEDNKLDFIDVLPPTYCDKGGHRERSIANSPQHREHWKKEERTDWTLPKIRVTI